MIRLFFKSFLFTLIVPGIVAFALPAFITNEMSANEGVLSMLALLFMLLAIAIYCWCVWDFVIFGMGTPAPIDSPKKLVSSGLYCFTRNPMYIAVFCFITGWVLLYFNWPVFLYAMSIMSCIQVLVIYYEEPVLLQLFGNEYCDYKKDVNRWLPHQLLVFKTKA